MRPALYVSAHSSFNRRIRSKLTSRSRVLAIAPRLPANGRDGTSSHVSSPFSSRRACGGVEQRAHLVISRL